MHLIFVLESSDSDTSHDTYEYDSLLFSVLRPITFVSTEEF